MKTQTQLGIDYYTTGAVRLELAKAKRVGTEFAIIRGTYGITKDVGFKRDWEAFAAAKLVRGAYMFPVMHKNRAPEPQIAAFVSQVTGAGGLTPGKDLPPVLDVEFSKGIAATGMTRLQCVDWIERAIDGLTRAFGCTPMLYTSARVWDGEDQDSLDLDAVPTPRIADCPLWLARYPYKKGPSRHAPKYRDDLKKPAVPKQLGDADDVWIHQYQGDATPFPGINRSVDLNRFFYAVRGGTGVERTKWIQNKLNKRGYTLVVDGDWGNKTARALCELQSREKIPGTGVVDLRTFCMLAWQ